MACLHVEVGVALMATPATMVRGAVISDDEKYRYVLTRVWDELLPTLSAVLLNPSKASHLDDDNTADKFVRICTNLGYGGFRFGNLFAWRSTKPEGLLTTVDPVGPDNDDTLRAMAADGPLVAAWGLPSNSRVQRLTKIRAYDVVTSVLPGVEWSCFDVTKDGWPRHPLYLPDASTLRPWRLP